MFSSPQEPSTSSKTPGFTKPCTDLRIAPVARLVQPRCMVCVDHSAWYVLADDPALPDEEPHTFALFRMSDAADTGRKFEPGKPFDIEAILQDSLGIHRGGPNRACA